MMRNVYPDPADFCCPFFDYAGRTQVFCEGGRIRLPDPVSRAEYRAEYCCDVNGWRRCTVARAISLHYERAEDF